MFDNIDSVVNVKLYGFDYVNVEKKDIVSLLKECQEYLGRKIMLTVIKSESSNAENNGGVFIVEIVSKYPAEYIKIALKTLMSAKQVDPIFM